MTKSFRVAAIGGRRILGHPEVILVARDGEAWIVQSLYNKTTMQPFKPGEDVEIGVYAGPAILAAGRETSEDQWGRAGYECPRPLQVCPPAHVAIVYADPPPSPKPLVRKRAASEAPPGYDYMGAIIEYEQGGLDGPGVLRLFSHLIRTGLAWSLQGAYGRMATTLIAGGYLEPKTGRIRRDLNPEGD